MTKESCSCLKYLLFVFNFILFLIGSAILGLGIWLKVEKEEYADISRYDYLIAANVAIGIGVLVLVIAFLGCCGAIKEVPPMLIAFFVLLLLIFILEVAICIFAYAKRSELEEDLKADLTQVMLRKYIRGGEEGLTKAVDTFQEKFDCCGIDSFADWKSSLFYRRKNTFPVTCCKPGLSKSVCPTNNENEWSKIYKSKGCYNELKDFLKENFLFIGVTSIIFSIFQVLGMIFAMVLYRAIR